MIKNKTVLVIGAGASAEAGLPIGSELKRRISNLVDIQVQHYEVTGADSRYWAAVRIAAEKRAQAEKKAVDLNVYLQAGYRIRDAMPQTISIDNFIDTQKGDEAIELCGKLAIARVILSAERSSKLYIDPSNTYNRINFGALEQTWFTSFMKLLTQNCRVSDVPERLAKVTLISFNYDRCVEHFIYHSLQNLYPILLSDAAKLVNGMTIHHPYGMIGKLPWEVRPGEAIEYGDEPNAHQLLKMAMQLRTFTEEMDLNSEAVAKMRETIREAKMIVFLGFAFHRENLELLLPEQAAYQPREAGVATFATGKGQSKSGCEQVRGTLNHRLGGPVYIDSEVTCEALFTEYWRHLSLS